MSKAACLSTREVGFTLIELVCVIIILGVIGAAAGSRLVNVSRSAHVATVASIASTLSSASSLNHAQNLAYDAGLSTTLPRRISNCRATQFLITSTIEIPYILRGGTGTAVSSGGIAVEGGVSECLVVYDSNGNEIWDNTDTPSASYIVHGVYN
jgi:MSHA pilin protein MshA